MPEFCQLWRIPLEILEAEKNRLYREMIDLELVLRSLALCEYENMGGAFAAYLTEFLAARNAAYATNLASRLVDERRFFYAIRNCSRIFGDSAFVKPTSQSKSVPLSDAVMVSLSDRQPEHFTAEHDERVRRGFIALLEQEDFQRSILAGTNGKGAITTRITLARQVVAQAFG